MARFLGTAEALESQERAYANGDVARAVGEPDAVNAHLLAQAGGGHVSKLKGDHRRNHTFANGFSTYPLIT